MSKFTLFCKIGVAASLICLALGSSVIAEPVKIKRKNDRAHGFMLHYAGNCYVIVPRHAVEVGQRFPFSTSDPVENGSGTAHTPFWGADKETYALDLALLVVSRGGEERCRSSGSELLSHSFVPAVDQSGDLVVIRDDGQIRRRPMKISLSGYLTFEAAFSNVDPGEDAVFQGMSGSFLYVDQRPIGMAIKKVGPQTVRFIRIEEIGMNVSRWLASQGSRFETREPEARESSTGAMVMELSKATASPIDGDSLPENVLEETGAYIFLPDGPASLVLELPGDEAVAVSRVTIISEVDEGQSVPKSVRIEVDNSRTASRRWRTFWGGQMRPDGVLDTGRRGAGTLARRLRITISSSWSPGPVRIDRITTR